jgi:hypothetical protein
MESIISEKQRRSNKNEKSVDDAVAVVSETSGSCFIPECFWCHKGFVLCLLPTRSTASSVI